MLAKQFMFEGREERLRHRVVERATDAPHRLADPKRPARGPERVGGVLGSLIGMEDHAGDVAAAHRDRHVDRGLGELRVRILLTHREAEQAPRVEVLDRSEEQWSFVGVDLLEVTAPLDVRRVSVEVATHQVGRAPRPLVRPGQAPVVPVSWRWALKVSRSMTALTSRGSGMTCAHSLNGRLEATATEDFSSRSVRIWKRSSLPRLSSWT